jgi:hypothetical protein
MCGATEPSIQELFDQHGIVKMQYQLKDDPNSQTYTLTGSCLEKVRAIVAKGQVLTILVPVNGTRYLQPYGFCQNWHFWNAQEEEVKLG